MPQLPTINSLTLLLPQLKLWQQTLNATLNLPVAPRSPFNFTAVGGAAGAVGITLTWEAVVGADGYEIQASTNGDFTNAPTIASVGANAGTSWFDSTSVTGIKRWYRIRTTAGTPRGLGGPKALHTIKGIYSAPIIATSGSGTTVYDQKSHTSGPNGWNRGSNPGIGNRRFFR